MTLLESFCLGIFYNVKWFSDRLCANLEKLLCLVKLLDSIVFREVRKAVAICYECSGLLIPLSSLFFVRFIPRSHQSLNMFKSCLVNHGLKLFSL